MKRFVGFVFIAMVLGCFVACGTAVPDARKIATDAQEASARKAACAVPIPQISYFQEKRTIAKWAERWNKPNVATYVYLVSYGKIIGYYVSDGKPASTRSYLMPEQMDLYPHGSASAIVDAPDIDGTYGTNNPGIRFFTAEGVAVEWGGEGADYIYSDAPLPIDVPRLNVKK